jgi:hypothetical protein
VKKSIILVADDAKEIFVDRRLQLDGDTGGRMAGTSVTLHDPALGVSISMGLGEYGAGATVHVGGACSQKFWSSSEIAGLKAENAEYEKAKASHKGLRLTYYAQPWVWEEEGQ